MFHQCNKNKLIDIIETAAEILLINPINSLYFRSLLNVAGTTQRVRMEMSDSSYSTIMLYLYLYVTSMNNITIAPYDYTCIS